MQPASSDPVGECVRGLCDHLREIFVADPLQTMWEGHMQYLTARWLMEQGHALRFGEPGGDNRKVVSVSFRDGQYRIHRSAGDCSDSADLRVSFSGIEIVFELKTFPSVGRKRGRAGLEKGLRKDWNAVTTASAPLAFVFVADRASYLSIRGHREGGRGPKMKWYIDLPAIEDVPYHDAYLRSPGAPVLFRFQSSNEERVVAGMWQPSHAWKWEDREPPW